MTSVQTSSFLAILLLIPVAMAETGEKKSTRIDSSLPAIIIAGDRWCPINCAEKSDQQGYMVDVARMAFKRVGYNLTYQEMPWARAIVEARAGSINGVVGAFIDDVPDFYFPSPLLNISPANFFTLTESKWVYKDTTSLEGSTLGVIRNYDYGEKLNTYIKANNPNHKIIQLSGNSTVERNIKLLMRGRVDIIAESPAILWYTAKKMNTASLIKNAGESAKAESCYIAFSPTHPNSKNLIKLFNTEVRKLEDEGVLRSLAASYGLPDALLSK